MLNRAKTALSSLVPGASNHRQEEDPGIPRVYNEAYFYGRITRQEAEDILLINGMTDGLYLLRESITPMGNFTLSMSNNDRVVHYSIEKKIDGQYQITDGVPFKDPVDLINYYQSHKTGFVCVPKRPCTRQPNQEAIAFRGLSYKDLHAHMKTVGKDMNAIMTRAMGPMRESFLMHVLRNMHEKMGWYHGKISREECNKRLVESGHEDGKFMIRKRSDDQTFALTLSYEGDIRHYFILVNDGETYSIENGQRFKAIIILVDHYHNKRDGLPSKLTVPCFHPDVKHNEWEKYMKLSTNLTQKPGVKTTNHGISPLPPSDLPVSESVRIPPKRTPPQPPVSSSGSRTPDRPPPPIPSSNRGATPTRTTSEVWNTLDDDVSLEDEDFAAVRNYTHSPRVDELESVYIDIREDVLSRDLKAENVKLGSKLGSGQFGEVKRGTCQLSRKTIPVAVKTLKTNDPAGEREILGEANVMKRLDHPHIVRMIGVCKGESVMLVMELAELGPLKQYLEKNQNLKVWHLVEFMSQICDGMSYLESMDVVHRDLATRNVLLVSEHFAKISDFGLSRMVDSNSDYYRAQCPGRWPLMWYAPECIYYHKFDSKSDVWSFGITMWEIMSFGLRPYSKMDPSKILGFLEAGNRLPKPKNCDNRLYDLMLHCWERRKDDRPNFKEIGPALKQLQYEFSGGEL